MSKSALIILAPGAEEMEFIIAADVLRRAGVRALCSIDQRILRTIYIPYMLDQGHRCRSHRFGGTCEVLEGYFDCAGHVFVESSI